MKKLVMMTALATTLAAGALQAAETTPKTGLQQGAVFTTTTVAGTVLAGPVGMLLGALGGAWVNEQIAQAAEVTEMAEARAQAENRIDQLQQQLQASEGMQEQWQQLALQSLDQRVLFGSGSDQLTDAGREQVIRLAGLLQAYPALQVRLDGYADPRGTDEYNNVLSQHRALTVRDALLAAGVAGQRVQVFSHGASRATAAQGDAAAYSAERRVEVEVSSPTEGSGAMVMN